MRLNHAVQAEIARLGGDPTDPIWRWFVINGPHGADFSWGQRRNEPAGYVGLDHLREIVAEHSAADPSFPDPARAIVRSALKSDLPELVRRAVQVSAALGLEDELPTIRELAGHADSAVAADARSAAFVFSSGRGGPNALT